MFIFSFYVCKFFPSLTLEVFISIQLRRENKHIIHINYFIIKMLTLVKRYERKKPSYSD